MNSNFSRKNVISGFMAHVQFSISDGCLSIQKLIGNVTLLVLETSDKSC